MNKRSIQPAFPSKSQQGFMSEGMTKREYFAALAMQGLCACSIAGSHKMFDTLAKEAVLYADELIKALDNSGNKPD
jgi:hypothetical protein